MWREHVQIDPAVKHPEHARPVPVRRRQAAQGQLDAGEDRLLPAAGELLLHLRHQLDERFAGGLDAAAAQRRGQQRQRAGVAMDGVHELLDLLAGGVAGRAGVPAGGVQHPLDQLHRILAVELVQFPPVPLGIERRGQRLAAGEDEPRVALGIEPRAELEDGVQFAARVLGEGLGRFLGQEGRQQDALHVVHHQQGRLLGQRALDRQDGFFQVVERGDGVILPDQLAAEGIEHRLDMAVRLDRDERGAAHLLRADQPAGELGGERGLAFAALAAHHGVAFGAAASRWSASSSRLRPTKPVSGSCGSSPRRAASAVWKSATVCFAGAILKSCGSSFSWNSTGTNQSSSRNSPAPKMRPRKVSSFNARWPASMASPTRLPPASAR